MPEYTIVAGRVGRPHGLDGSFHVVAPESGALRAALLAEQVEVLVGGRIARVVRRSGTAQRPILRLEGMQRREDAEALRGLQLLVSAEHAPELGEQEWWAHELEGCAVVDGAAAVGVVRRMIELPSCEALEVIDESGTELLVPMVSDAIRSVDVQARVIDIDRAFLGLTSEGEE